VNSGGDTTELPKRLLHTVERVQKRAAGLNASAERAIEEAIEREKQLKGWARAKKIALFERRNPQWKDLASEWYPWMQPGDRDASTPR